MDVAAPEQEEVFCASLASDVMKVDDSRAKIRDGRAWKILDAQSFSCLLRRGIEDALDFVTVLGELGG